MKFTEAKLEQAIIEPLKGEGYVYVPDQEIFEQAENFKKYQRSQ